MTGDTLRGLLEPVVGKAGSLSLLIIRIGQVAVGAGEDKKVTGVTVLPEGLVRLERETGWTVLDPAGVVAVTWRGDPDDASPGQFL